VGIKDHVASHLRVGGVGEDGFGVAEGHLAQDQTFRFEGREIFEDLFYGRWPPQPGPNAAT
jgi:hypothetical protein